MKTRKMLIITLIVAAIGVGVVAIAATVQQEPQGPAGMGWFGFFAKQVNIPKMIMGHIKERLNLTAEQETQIQPILEKAVQDGVAMFQKHRGQAFQGFETLKTERETMWQETEKQLAAILTPEQMQELQKMHVEQIGKFQNMRHGFAGGFFQAGGEVRQLVQDLNLSDVQKQQLFSIFLKYRDDRRTAVGSFLQKGTEAVNRLLTEDFDEAKVRQTFRDSEAQREEFIVSHAKMLAEMKAVLNPDQLQLLQQKVPALLASIQDRIHTGRSMMDNWLQPQNN
jgi:Spy/CpxP family protein refolding chaperone